jgi:hypothetical protein
LPVAAACPDGCDAGSGGATGVRSGAGRYIGLHGADQYRAGELAGELEVPCAEPNREACEAKNGQIRAMLEIVEQRRQRKADECETLAQVNRLLRTLPPKG